MGFAGFPPISAGLREALLGPNRKLPLEEATEVVYLKRQYGLPRNVKNEMALQLAVSGALKPPFTFKVVSFTGEIKRDSELMRRARVVMGPHGGAFSNLLYCSIESIHPIHVIEFVRLREGYEDWSANPEKYILTSQVHSMTQSHTTQHNALNNALSLQYANNNFYGFANWLGMRYWMVEPMRYFHDGIDMIVPVEQVLAILDKIGLLLPPAQRRFLPPLTLVPPN